MTKFKLRAPSYPTESDEKVKKAIKKIFPKIELTEEQRDNYNEIIAEGTREDLETLREKILEQRISDTARSVILEKNQYFELNKQAATVGKVNFTEEAPLGTIKVELYKIEKDLIDWLTPKTKDGKPIK